MVPDDAVVCFVVAGEPGAEKLSIRPVNELVSSGSSVWALARRVLIPMVRAVVV